jgi:hypothetical protein
MMGALPLSLAESDPVSFVAPSFEPGPSVPASVPPPGVVLSVELELQANATNDNAEMRKRAERARMNDLPVEVREAF